MIAAADISQNKESTVLGEDFDKIFKAKPYSPIKALPIACQITGCHANMMSSNSKTMTIRRLKSI